MLVSDFDFDLPQELIAQEPPAVRGSSRLLVLDRATGTTEHRTFPALLDCLHAGDLLVLNDTRVNPARLLGRRMPGGGAVECLLLSRASGADAGPAVDARAERWSALLRPGQRIRPGARLLFERDGASLHAEVLEADPSGARIVRLWADAGSVAEALDRVGHIPLPPYIARADTAADRDRYQTVFATSPGSVAAPTAGLHFTQAMLDDARSRGIEIAGLTLHVGYGTFKPVRTREVESHTVDPELYQVPEQTADALTRTRREGRRIVAVGTTTTRVLESLDVEPDGRVVAASGETRTFIYPGHRFRIVSGLVTNFHLPQSSLLMLVAAFGGRAHVLAAYRDAVARGYRFYSYGDAMLIV